MSSTSARTSGKGTATGTSSAVTTSNRGRRAITICNDHATQIIYLQLATNADVAPTAVLNEGVRLNAAGGSWTATDWDGAIACIATGAGTGYTIVEY
jgi:hypothetical protein